MVKAAVGDIIEITDSDFEDKTVKLKGRRYWVRKVKKGGALNASPIVPENPLYQQGDSGKNWVELGLSDKGRPRSIPKKVYKIIGTMAQGKDGKANNATAKLTGEEPSEEEPSDEEEVLIPAGVSVSPEVEELLTKGQKETNVMSTKQEKEMEKTGLCFNTALIPPFEQAREIDACRIPLEDGASPEWRMIQLDKVTGAGFRVRVCFSAPIDFTNPLTYTSQADLKKKMMKNTTQKYMILRQYEIGAKVKDICGASAKEIKGIQWHTEGEPFNMEAEVVSMTLTWSVTKKCPDNSSPMKIVIWLEGADGNGFSLEHEIQQVEFIGAPPSATTAGSPFGGGMKTDTGTEGSKVTGSPFGSGLPTGDGDVPATVMIGSKVTVEPELAVNKFPNTQKGVAPALYELRSILSMSYDHDHPAFAAFEKEYVVVWDDCPSIVTKDTGYVQIVFEVKEGEGSVTNRFAGKWENTQMLKKHIEMWPNYPRRVILILPHADSQYLYCPTDEITPDKDSEVSLSFEEFPRESWINDVQEVKYYESKDVIKDIRLMQNYSATKVSGFDETKTEERTLIKTMKVGEMYELGVKEPATEIISILKGRLVKVEVSTEGSRDNIFLSAESERRSLRVIEDYEVFFATEKDDKNKTRFIVVLANEKGKANSGQIIRIDLSKSERGTEKVGE